MKRPRYLVSGQQGDQQLISLENQKKSLLIKINRRAPKEGGGGSSLYTLFQNGRHLNILLFLFKLAFDASFLSLKFKKNILSRTRQQGPICIRINQRPFWNKVYEVSISVSDARLRMNNCRLTVSEDIRSAIMLAARTETDIGRRVGLPHLQ